MRLTLGERNKIAQTQYCTSKNPAKKVIWLTSILLESLPLAGVQRFSDKLYGYPQAGMTTPVPVETQVSAPTW